MGLKTLDQSGCEREAVAVNQRPPNRISRSPWLGSTTSAGVAHSGRALLPMEVGITPRVATAAGGVSAPLGCAAYRARAGAPVRACDGGEFRNDSLQPADVAAFAATLRVSSRTQSGVARPDRETTCAPAVAEEVPRFSGHGELRAAVDERWFS